MSHDIIDNRSEKLVDHIRDILPGSQAAKFAVGYFFISGLQAIADRLDNVQDLRLLIGNTSSRQTIEQIAEGYQRLEQIQHAAQGERYLGRHQMKQRVAATGEAVSQALALTDQTDAAEALARTLVDLIAAGRLKVRVYTRERLHAKAYIFDYGPHQDPHYGVMPRYEKGIAVVGSSNFTLAGVTTNTELNVIVHGNDNHAALTAWFEALWENAEDFDTHLMQALQHAWPLARVTPYELYLKALYELVRDQLDGDDTEAGDAIAAWDRSGITAVLTDFQRRAVAQAVRMIDRYGGCFISDVVGLGKSYIGAALLKHFERRDRARPLIVCPPPLVEMWEHYNRAYQLNARVLSMGLLREDDSFGPEWMLHDERYRYCNVVLVDESHSFRNTGTQRYRVLQSFLATEDKRVILMTATPRNKSVWDIYNQLKLFHHREVTDLPIDPPHLRDYVKLVETGERRLSELLAPLLIRRKRLDVLRWYGYDAETDARVDPDAIAPYKSGQRRAYVWVGGRKQFFPERTLETIDYSIEDVYGGLYEELRSCLAPAGATAAAGCAGCPPDHTPLTYARYGLWHYVKSARRHRPPYADLRRAGANLRGLMRVMLFKRFESSVYAFRSTVEKLLRTHQAFLTSLDAGIVAAGNDAQEILSGSDAYDEQALVEALAAVTTSYDIAHLNTDVLRTDIEHDIEVLTHMRSLVAPITPDQDDKLQTLIARLRRPPLHGRKVLIFTQYADTAHYLYENVAQVLTEAEVDVIFSQGKSKARIVERFAPRANPHSVRTGDQGPGTPVDPPQNEIDILIATDVLSEGLNLQDCDTVINYDLHWNPVRLIQRFGRVDRIGTEHDRIYGYNFLPERTLEANLGLQHTLRQRIQEIHDTIGEDAAILDETERLNEEALYAIYAQGDVSAYDTEDSESDYLDMNDALERLRQIRKDQPDLFERIVALKDGVRCGRRYSDGRTETGTIVLCRAGRYRQLVLVNEDGEIISREPARILKLMACEPDEPAAPLPPGHNARVTAVKRDFAEDADARRSERDTTVATSPAQTYVLQELGALYMASEPEQQREITRMEIIFRNHIARPAVHTALNRIRRERLTGDALLRRLTELAHAHNLEAPVPQPASQPADVAPADVPRVICSEGWTP